ncbi:DUF982 domain-containing protein [Agrobacterium sp.]|uniref:DUF982 domain-containing protein n=1 Tax=Agrobacterium sp. TaxID=361 RepID=UPI0028B21A7E|nr:DUF982 domain-containing protein [Agrobacterium sp.]
MPTLSWKPIEVKMPGGTQMVHGPYSALHFLTDEWPDARGPAYVEARRFCRAALDGRKTAEEARERFMAAACEAKLAQETATSSRKN